MKQGFVVLGLISVLGLAACSEKSATDPPATATLAITLGSATGQITQAGTLAVTVNVSRSNFEGAVLVTATGMDAITGAALTIPSNATSGTLTLTADAAAGPGTGTVTITATGPSGTPAATATLAMTVNVRGTYTLAVNPVSLPLAAGASGTSTIAINRVNNFAGTVNLAVTAPNGINATVTPTAATGAAATLNVLVASTVVAGNYPIVINGATTGLANQSAALALTVTSAGAFTTSLSPVSLTMRPGASATSTLHIARSGNFTGTVTVTATAPTGLTATVASPSVTGNSTAITIAAGATTATGNYTVNVASNANGIGQQMTTLAVTVAAPTAPPFGGTIFIDPDIITPSDPSAFVGLSYAGQASRTMFDRRVNNWITVNAFLFNASFDDGLTVEVQVNPEFGTAAASQTHAQLYATAVGRLPTALRRDVRTMWIHQGVQPFGGGNNNILIHVGQADLYVRDGILEETLVHEAAHSSLDASHAAAPGWLAAQAADPAFISNYARDFPTREDVAESFLPWLAVRYRAVRISESLRTTIQSAIPNRLAYFDGLALPMHPIR
ncbi:MAG: hypothetical protein ACRENP_25035 [Longimicrobiales bacterium]